MKHLRGMIGEEIIGLIPMMDHKIFQTMILHGVEEDGISVENQKMTTITLKALKQGSSSRTPLFFVPFHEIKFLVQSTEKSSLSEKAFGLWLRRVRTNIAVRFVLKGCTLGEVLYPVGLSIPTGSLTRVRRIRLLTAHEAYADAKARPTRRAV